MKIGTIKFTTACAGFAAVFALMILAIPARSAGPAVPVFPLGSHIGLVPPPGMVPSKTFAGFVDPANNAGIVMSVFPAGAYDDMEKTLTVDALKKAGITTGKARVAAACRRQGRSRHRHAPRPRQDAVP